jgi:hypothetical protein
VASVVTPTDATLYLNSGDGLKSAKHVMEHGPLAMGARIQIGRDDFGNVLRNWKGAIDDVRVWKKALTPEEIEASMNTAPPAGDPGLLAWWDSMKPSLLNMMSRSSPSPCVRSAPLPMADSGLARTKG